jgi:hypothetical protein
MLAAIVAACVFAALVPMSASAQAAGERSWSDDFATARKIARNDGTKVSGSKLKLSESLPPTDMGEAVPGESSVYSLVSVDSDVYCGTGEKGHLVQYKADKLYQEAYRGPSHKGVSSSMGQVSPDAAGPVRVTALATDGTKVFGGTSAGHIFTFDPSREGNRPVDRDPGVTGGIVSAAYSGSHVFFGTDSGYVFTYDPAGDTFASLGQVAASAAGSMAVTGGAVYVGFDSGQIFKYEGGSFTPLETPFGAHVNALTFSGAVLCAGLNDGSVFTYDTGTTGPFIPRGVPAAGSEVKSLAVQSGVVYAGASNGHVYRALDDWKDQGSSPYDGGAPVNALAVSPESNVLYGGTGSGRLFRRASEVYEDHGRPGDVGGMTSVAFDKRLYAAQGDHLYEFTSPGHYDVMGTPGSSINDIDANSGAVFMGLDNGHFYTYNADPDHPGVFQDKGAPASPSAVKSVVESSGLSYAGLEDGRLMDGNDMVGEPLASLPGASPSIKDMTYKESGSGAQRGLYIAGQDGNLYCWNGDGVSSFSVSSLLWDSTHTVLYAGTDGHGVWRCDDPTGVSPVWTSLGGGVSSVSIKSLALDTADSMLYAGTGGLGVWRCDDPQSAATWTQMSGSVSSYSVNSLLWDSSLTVLYAGTESHGAWRCDDLQGTPTWTSLGEGVSSLSINTLALDPASSMLYAGTDGGGVWRCDAPTGVSPVWTPLGGGVSSPSINTLALDPAGSMLYAGTDGGGVWRCDDPQSAATWTDTGGGVRWNSVKSLAYDSTGSVLWAGDSHGVSRCDNPGTVPSWTDTSLINMGNGGDTTPANAVAVYADKVFVGHQDGGVCSYGGGSFTALGVADAAIGSMATGSQGVLCGTADGKLYAQDDGGLMYYEGTVPHEGSVLALCHTGSSVWIGTDQGYLVSHDDANLGDLGVQVNKQIMVWCLTYDSWRNLYYAGTYTNAHFLVIDPANNYKVTDLGMPVSGEREIEDIIVTSTSDHTVVGATYGGTESLYNPEGGHLFTFDPDDSAGRPFTDRGRAPAPDDNWWISSLVEGPPSGNLIYAGTSNSALENIAGQGRLFSVDKTTWEKRDLGAPVTGQGTRTLTRKGNVIFGATWQPFEDWKSSVYKYDVTSPWPPIVLGESPPVGTQKPNKHINNLLAVGDYVYGAQNDGEMFKFKIDEADWDPISIGKPAARSVAVFPLVEGQDSTLLCGTTGGGDQDPTLGHLVNYDPGLGTYRDIDVSQVMADHSQDRVSAIARAPDDSDDHGTTLCATSRDQTLLPGGVARYAARLFTVDRYGLSGTASSTFIDPSIEGLALDPAGLGSWPPGATIKALCPAPAPDKRVFGVASNGTSSVLFLFDTMTDKLSGMWPCPGTTDATAVGTGPDGRVYIGGVAGTSAIMLRFDPVPPYATPTQVGSPIEAAGIFSFTAGTGGRLYLGTGDEADDNMGHLRSYDTGAAGDTTDLGPCGSSHMKVNALATSGDKVYGVISSMHGYTQTAAYFDCVPPAAPVTRGQFEAEFTAAGLVAGPDGKLYCGTGPAGLLFSATPGGNLQFEQETSFPRRSKSITAIAGTSGGVYGCAGDQADFFEWQGGQVIDAGPLTTTSGVVSAATTGSLGKPYFGTVDGALAAPVLERYNPTLAYKWLTAGADKDSAPPDTTATVSIQGVNGSSPMEVIGTATSPTTISGELLSQKALQFKVLMDRQFTPDTESRSPEVTKWKATWQVNASVDEFAYPHAQGVYGGEELRIWGSGFGSTDTPGTVSIGHRPATVSNWQPNYVQVTVPVGATDNSILIAPAGGPDPFTGTISLLQPSHIASIYPASGRVGDRVTVHGSGFLTRGAGDSVTFNGTEATAYTSWNDTEIQVQVPQGASTGDVIVSVNSHASNHAGFDVMGGGGPKVSITAPEDGSALKGAVTVTATVQRQGGTSPVELWVDGVKKASDSSAPYAFDWNADAVSDGAHTLKVKAVDGFSRQGSDAHTVYVDHTVPSPSKQWYFAEGCTNYGFETWLLIGNPGNRSAVAHVTFMDDKGETYIQACDLRPNSRTTVNAADVAPGANISIQVDADTPVVCERAMYWGNRIEGHDTIGAASLSSTWYFAEGSTDWGFQTFVLLGNPGDSTVKATLHYLFTDGTSTARDHVLAPHSRLTVNAAREVGAKDFSVKVDAGAPGIVAERSIYHGDPRRCGTNTVGVKAPSVSWYLSEGSTDWGFETWLLIQRPASGDAHVTATFRKGNGESVKRTYTVKGNSRFTVNLADEVGIADVSTQVTSDVPVVCERSMYWNARTAGHCTIGSPGPGRTWLLAEGCTDYGFETWVLLDNPNASAVNATVTFLKEDGTTVPVALVLKPQTRLSIDASVYVGADSFSTRVDAASPVMVERAMYWSRRSGGTGSIGAR